jgi:hypothetical protein
MINNKAEGWSIKKLFKENIIALCFLVSIPLINVFYWMLNNSNRGIYNLVTDIDKATPFVSAFVIPYVLWYPFVFFMFLFLCVKDRDIYYKTLISYDIGVIICYIIYFAFQTTVPRPEIVGSDIFSRLLVIIYSNDQPFNCFPSIHVLNCYLMIKAINACKVSNRKNRLIVFLISTIIILSTLFIKQHVILDAFSAMFIGGITFNLVKRIDLERTLAWIKKQYSLLTMKKKLET